VEVFAHSYTDNGECKRQNEGTIIFGHFENLTRTRHAQWNIPHIISSGQIMIRGQGSAGFAQLSA
jgi:hypothetical protein